MFLSKISGKDLVVPQRKGNSKSKKKQLITSINNEIMLLGERDDLTLQKINKRLNGKMCEVNESRFWRHHPNNPNLVYLTIKHRKKIWWFGEKEDRLNPPYIQINNNKEDVLTELQNIKENLEKEDENSNLFKTFSQIQSERVNDVVKEEVKE